MASSTLTGDKAQLQSAANNTDTCLKELERELALLAEVQGHLQQAVQSDHTGQRIYAALGDAWEQGKSLAGTMGSIIESLSVAGAHIDSKDLEGAAQIASQVASGAPTPEIGGWSGGINIGVLNSIT